MIHRRSRLAAALAIAALLAVPGAAAADTVVTLVRPRAASALSREAMARLAAELSAAGFVVRFVDPSGGEPRDEVERVEGSIAAISIVPTARGAIADVWIADRVTGKTVVRRVDVIDPARANAASDLAVRSVELLRASLLEINQRNEPPRDIPAPVARLAEAAAPPAPPPSPAITPPTPAPRVDRAPGAPPAPARRTELAPAPPPAPPSPRVGVEAALALLASPEGGPALGPLLRLSLGLPARLALRFTVAPAAAPLTLEAPQGTVSVRQTVAGLDLAYAFGAPGARLRPLAALGGGLHALSVDGDARAGFISRRATAYSAFVSASAAVSLRFTEGVGVLLDLTALVLVPAQTVTAVGEPLARLGRPAFLPSLGLVADLD